MELVSITRLFALAGIAICIIGILFRLKEIMNRPFKKDLSRERGNPRRGILYAFTLGMAPWEKESTRQHWVAYLRGVFFHVGVFTAIGTLLISPWLSALPRSLALIGGGLTAVAALACFAGVAMRLREPDLRALSTPDDLFSIVITGLFVAAASATLFSISLLPVFYIVTGLTMAYIPFSKIRHCVYFFYSKFFFGFNFGRRGVIGQVPGPYAE